MRWREKHGTGDDKAKSKSRNSGIWKLKVTPPRRSDCPEEAICRTASILTSRPEGVRTPRLNDALGRVQGEGGISRIDSNAPRLSGFHSPRPKGPLDAQGKKAKASTIDSLKAKEGVNSNRKEFRENSLRTFGSLSRAMSGLKESLSMSFRRGSITPQASPRSSTPQAPAEDEIADRRKASPLANVPARNAVAANVESPIARRVNVSPQMPQRSGSRIERRQFTEVKTGKEYIVRNNYDSPLAAATMLRQSTNIAK